MSGTKLAKPCPDEEEARETKAAAAASGGLQCRGADQPGGPIRAAPWAIVGAAETTRLGVIPDMSQIQLHADAALNAMADAGLKAADRRGRDGRRDAGDDYALSRHHVQMDRRHRGRRLLVHDPCPPRRRGDRLGPLRDGI